MRIYSAFLFFFIFISSVLRGQESSLSRVLKWQKPQNLSISENVKIQFLNFDGAFYEGSTNFIPTYFEKINLPRNVNNIDVVLKNLVFETLTESDLIKNKELIDAEIKIKSAIGYEKKAPFGTISFIPIRKNSLSGNYEKLISFEIDIKMGAVFEKKTSSSKYYTPSSVLKGSNWYKIGVSEDGIYKLPYSFFTQLGVNPSTIDPRNIRIYGNGGGMLPLKNTDFRYDDLIENAISVVGEGDGKFDDTDYVLFYGQDPNRWKYNTSDKKFHHITHLFSDTTFYFLTIDLGSGKRISDQVSINQPVIHTVSSFNDYYIHENNTYNFIKSGREWYGETFDILTTRDFPFYIPNIEVSSLVYITSDVIAKSNYPSSFNVKVNGQQLLNEPIPAIGSNYYDDYARTVSGSISDSLYSSVPNINITLTYNKSTTTSVGWLNFLELNARRQLSMTGESQMNFRDINSVGPGDVSEFILSNVTSSTRIWDVTNPVNVSEQQTSFLNNQLRFSLFTDSLREFIAFNMLDFKTPTFFGKVENQNIHGIGQRDMIIIAYPPFVNEANRLAEFHRNHDSLSVEVLTPQKIYNEFSSGMQDISAIRDFIKMLYDRAGSDTNALPKHLLLFGDASYDYKRVSGNSNFVPTYESISSLAPITSYGTDDYYGLLDDNEGILQEGLQPDGSQLLDINIGRFPVQSVEQAKGVVDKIIHYSSPENTVGPVCTVCGNTNNGSSSLGDWRNNVTFVADDEDGDQHLYQADSYATMVSDSNKEYNVDKIFLDAYRQISTPGGQRYPDVTNAINKRIEKGALIINYTGHGGEVGWAHERVLEISDINSWTNYNNLPLFMTATCEFSRFDNPDLVSAGELVFLKPNGGGIALFTTTRLVYSSTNGVLNQLFYQNVFKSKNGKMPTMGEIFTKTKNQAFSNRNFILLGDPAVRLAYPTYKVITSAINGKAVSSSPDTLRALSLVRIAGHIEDNKGQKMTHFNGFLYPTIYDKPSTITTLGNDPTTNPDGGSPVTTFKLQKNVLYKGKASVINGDYSFSFLIPKDIAYQYGFGKISYYAENGSIDANGFSENIVIGGSPVNFVSDSKGPSIKLFMNDDKFIFGGTTDENPILQAVITDSSGINTVGNGIGHDITAVLDGDVSNLLVLNDYYQSDLNSYQKGKVSYRLTKLKEGRHSLKFKVWDVYNNSSESYLEFVVSNSAEFSLKYVLNYPNPFTAQTSFYFEHNKPCVSLDVQIQIYTLSGKLVKTIEENGVLTSGYRVGPIDWNGKDDFGDKIGKGVYVYRVKVRSKADGSVADKFEKLVILN